MDSKLSQFLQSHKVEGQIYTHVSMTTPKGKYQISRHDLEEFWDIYRNSIKNKANNVGIAEKPQHYLPILVDIDIKKQINEKDEIPEKLYTQEMLTQVIESTQVSHEIIIDNCTDKHLICLVLEKPLYTQEKNSIVYAKNGFHLQFPYTFMNKVDQEVHLLPRVKTILEQSQVFDSLNLPIDSIIDKSYTRIPWLLYGSKKEGGKHSYDVTNVYNANCETISIEEGLDGYRIYDVEEEEIDITDNIDKYLPQILSIVPFRRPQVEIKNNLEQPLKHRLMDVKETKNYSKDTTENELKLAKKLISILSKDRADNFNDWMTVGWALYNISEGSKDGLDLWLDFSKKCPEKYQESACMYEWTKMVKKDMTIGTLRKFAKSDNKEEYDKIIKDLMKPIIKQSLNGSHNDVAKALKESDYGQDFVCSSISYKSWYQYENHKWKRSDEGVGLRKKISDDIVKMYYSLHSEINQHYNRACESQNKGDMAKYQQETTEVRKMMNNLKSAPYKNNVMKESMEVFYDESFNQKLDSNPYVIGFKNGVYDLKANQFRDGKQEDYISMEMGVDYDKNMTSSDASVIEVYDFLEKVFPDKSIREYFLDTTSDVFVGGNSNKIFHVWSGEGDNAKSVTQLLLERMLGDYSVKLPTSLIVGKRTQASAACPELVRAGNGVRWAVLQEPDKKDILNIGILKELSGNDTFFARGLYKEGSEITPMFKLVLICNDPPQVPYSDKATWDRIRVLPFESTFCNDAPASFEEQLKEKRFPRSSFCR